MPRRAGIAAVAPGAPRLIDARSSPAMLAQAATLRRRARAPGRSRPGAFLESFESRLLFYDAFWHADGQRILLVGPPPLNLQWEYQTAKFTALPLEYWLGSRFYASESVMITELTDVPRDTTEVVVSLAGRDHVLPIRPNFAAEFAGANIVFAMSGDDDLERISEWGRYHARVQGADAAVVFDSGSTAHGPEDVEAALLAVPELQQVAVLPWPYKAGALDHAVLNNPAYPLFAQVAAMSVALRRFAPRAHGLLNCGVGERVETPPGSTVFGMLDATWRGLIVLRGRLVDALPAPPAVIPEPAADDGAGIRPEPVGRPIGQKRWALQPLRPWVSSLRVHPYMQGIRGRPAFAKSQPAEAFWLRTVSSAAGAGGAGQPDAMTASPDVMAPWQKLAAGLGMGALLVLPCVIGTLSSVLAILAALLLLPIAWRPGAVDAVRAEPGVAIQLAVFCVLALIFAVTMRTPHDLLYAGNFLGFALASVVLLAARSEAGADLARLLVRMCLAGAALGAAYAVFEVGLLGHGRASGWFSNPNVMSRVAVVLGFAALAGVWLPQMPGRLLCYLGPVFAAVVVVLTGSRGAALAVPVLGVVALVCFLRDSRTRRHVPVILAAVAVGAALVIALDPSGRIAETPSVVADALFGGTADDEAIALRMNMYSAALEAVRASPLIGVGWGNLGNAAAAADPENLGWAAKYHFMFHNDLLNFAVAGGVVGIACLLALLAAPIAGLARAPKDRFGLPRAYLCVMLTSGYAVLGLTDMAFGYDIETTLYAFLAALVLGGLREKATAAVPMQSSGGRPASLP